jgi:hypothetical protein
MPHINVVISEQSYLHAKKRSGFKGRGLGSYIDGLSKQDETRQEMRQLLEREREALPSKAFWEQTGLNLD